MMTTANIIWQDDLVKLPYGVYFGAVEYEKNTMPALISWGTKPTFKDMAQEVLEAHIYNFNQDIYYKTIKINFEKKLRDQIKFSSKEELINQLNIDYNEFLNWLKQ